MDAILLCMKKRGIRFFQKIKFQKTKVTRFHKKDNFLGLLCDREMYFDNVLLMAHGCAKGILNPTRNLSRPYEIYISLNETRNFRNDFVFAISCLTANEFGERCIEEGAIAYLGYQVEIGGLFSSESKEIPKKIRGAVDIIIKRIFLEELSLSYEKFLTELISVQLLKEYFSFSLEKRISSIANMTPEEIYNEFDIKISDRNYQKYFVATILNTLSYLDEVSNRLICIGDSNYISSSSLISRKRNGLDSATLLNELENNQFFVKLKHTLYKKYLRDLTSVEFSNRR